MYSNDDDGAPTLRQLRQNKRRVIGYVENLLSPEALKLGTFVNVIQVDGPTPEICPLITNFSIVFPEPDVGDDDEKEKKPKELVPGLAESATGGTYRAKIFRPLSLVTKNDVLDALPPSFPGGRRSIKNLCLRARDMLLSHVHQTMGEDDLEGRKELAKFVMESLKVYLERGCVAPTVGKDFPSLQVEQNERVGQAGMTTPRVWGDDGITYDRNLPPPKPPPPPQVADGDCRTSGMSTPVHNNKSPPRGRTTAPASNNVGYGRDGPPYRLRSRGSSNELQTISTMSEGSDNRELGNVVDESGLWEGLVAKPPDAQTPAVGGVPPRHPGAGGRGGADADFEDVWRGVLPDPTPDLRPPRSVTPNATRDSYGVPPRPPPGGVLMSNAARPYSPPSSVPPNASSGMSSENDTSIVSLPDDKAPLATVNAFSSPPGVPPMTQDELVHSGASAIRVLIRGGGTVDLRRDGSNTVDDSLKGPWEKEDTNAVRPQESGAASPDAILNDIDNSAVDMLAGSAAVREELRHNRSQVNAITVWKGPSNNRYKDMLASPIPPPPPPPPPPPLHAMAMTEEEHLRLLEQQEKLEEAQRRKILKQQQQAAIKQQLAALEEQERQKILKQQGALEEADRKKLLAQQQQAAPVEAQQRNLAEQQQQAVEAFDKAQRRKQMEEQVVLKETQQKRMVEQQQQQAAFDEAQRQKRIEELASLEEAQRRRLAEQQQAAPSKELQKQKRMEEQVLLEKERRQKIVERQRVLLEERQRQKILEQKAERYEQQRRVQDLEQQPILVGGPSVSPGASRSSPHGGLNKSSRIATTPATAPQSPRERQVRHHWSPLSNGTMRADARREERGFGRNKEDLAVVSSAERARERRRERMMRGRR